MPITFPINICTLLLPVAFVASCANVPAVHLGRSFHQYQQKPNNEGNTWEKVTDRVIHADNLHQTSRSGLFQVSNGVAGAEFVYNSLDDGKTWEMELSTFDQRFLK